MGAYSPCIVIPLLAQSLQLTAHHRSIVINRFLIDHRTLLGYSRIIYSQCSKEWPSSLFLSLLDDRQALIVLFQCWCWQWVGNSDLWTVVHGTNSSSWSSMASPLSPPLPLSLRFTVERIRERGAFFCAHVENCLSQKLQHFLSFKYI